MKPVDFAYQRPRSLEDALAALAEGAGEARVLAGGQSLVPLLNMRLVRPATLVDINALPGLDGIAAGPDGGLVIGALVRHQALATSPLVRARLPLLAEAARHVGHRAIRNRGTLGGSLAHADPAAELPAAVLALEGSLEVAGRRGARRVAAADFAVGPLATVLAPDEILTAIHVAPAPGTAWGFAEVARRHGDFALAGVAAVLGPDARDPTRSAAGTLVALGVGPGPVRLRAAEALLAGEPVTTPLARAAGAAAAAACDPPDDVHASAAYRRHLVGVLTERVLLEAAARRAPR